MNLPLDCSRFNDRVLIRAPCFLFWGILRRFSKSRPIFRPKISLVRFLRKKRSFFRVIINPPLKNFVKNISFLLDR